MSGITEQDIEDYMSGYKDYASPLFNMLNSQHAKILDNITNAFMKSYTSNDPSNVELVREQIRVLISSTFQSKLTAALGKLHEQYQQTFKANDQIKEFVKIRMEHEKNKAEQKANVKESYNESYKKLLSLMVKIRSTRKASEALKQMANDYTKLNINRVGLLQNAQLCSKKLDEYRSKSVTTESSKIAFPKRKGSFKFVIRRVLGDEDAITSFAPIVESRWAARAKQKDEH